MASNLIGLSGRICTCSTGVLYCSIHLQQKVNEAGRCWFFQYVVSAADFTGSTGWCEVSKRDSFVESFFCSPIPLPRRAPEKGACLSPLRLPSEVLVRGSSDAHGRYLLWREVKDWSRPSVLNK